MTMLSTIRQSALCGAARRYGVFLLLASIAPSDAFANPLDKNACAKLAQDMQNLKALEVDKLMENGPSWAMSHLSPVQIALVRQYIDLDEQMKFRCAAPSSLVHLKNLEPEPEDGTATAEAGTADTDNASGDQATATHPPRSLKPRPPPSLQRRRRSPSRIIQRLIVKRLTANYICHLDLIIQNRHVWRCLPIIPTR